MTSGSQRCTSWHETQERYPLSARDPSSAKSGISVGPAATIAGGGQQAAHQAAPREVHQVRLGAGRDVRPLVVPGPMTAGAGAATLVAAFAKTAVPQRACLRRPVHRVAGAADPAHLRVLPVAIQRRRGGDPQVVIGADDHRLFGVAGKAQRGVAVGAHAQEARRRFRGRPGAADRRPAVRVVAGRAGDPPAWLALAGVAVQRQVGPVVLPRAHADRMPALTDGRARGHLPRGVADLARVGSRGGFCSRVSAVVRARRRAAGPRGRCGRARRPRLFAPDFVRSCGVPSTAACAAWQPVHRAAGPAAERTRNLVPASPSAAPPRSAASAGFQRCGSWQPTQPTFLSPFTPAAAEAG